MFPIRFTFSIHLFSESSAEKLATGLTDFETYIRNNREFIPNFGSDIGRAKRQHSFRGVDDQPGGESALREETADAVVA
jgi:hypothetical protein